MISVVIPTYGQVGVGLVETCIATLWAHHEDAIQSVEIFVVLDGSDAEVESGLRRVAEGYTNVVVLVQEERLGFASACNLGIAASSGAVVFLVNNDIEFYEPALQAMADCLIQLNAGVVGCRLLYPDRSVQHGGVVYVRGQGVDGVPGWFDHRSRSCREFDPEAYSITPSLVTGALMGISRQALLACGPLDERYGFTCEDIDYCLQSLEAGFNPIYLGYVGAIHHEGKTRGATPEEKAKMPEIAEREQQALKLFHEKWVGVDFQNVFRGRG